MIFFAINVFLSAFLLFQIELIIANFYLPIYGGSYAVWGSCVVFFQTVLLLGYCFAKFIPEKIGLFNYRKFHILFMALPLLFFPGRPLKIFTFNESLPITFNIFAQLFLNIGAVFFVLSSLSVVNQVWLSKTKLQTKTDPYILFSISNLGSFGGLLTYPFFFEEHFGVQQQLLFWRIGYLCLIAINVFIMLRFKVPKEEKIAAAPLEPVEPRTIIRWLLLSAAGVAFFLSVTNVITLEIVPMPLLWVIPLCIYLISFTFNFKRNPWCPSWIVDKIHIFIGLGIFIHFLGQKKTMQFLVVAAVYFFLLFVYCMYCQRELYRTRPGTGRLPFFYVINALGGFIGGVFVSWIVPLINDSLIEFMYSLLLLALALCAGPQRKKAGLFDWILLAGLFIVIWGYPQIFTGYSLIGLALLVLSYIYVFSQWREKYTLIVTSLVLVIALKSVVGFYWRVRDFTFSHRNYYGIYHIYVEDQKKYLLHGQIIHGLQYVDPAKEMIPLLYYHPQSTYGDLFTSDRFHFKNVGIIGLGIGVLAAYANPGQTYDFFELDYDDYLIANKYFTFLKNARGKINHYIGDARLRIEDAPTDHYDLFVVDAFTGDSIPSHLITYEAVERYRHHLKKDGIIFFHISNRYLRLGPVLGRIAGELGAYFAWQQKIPESDNVFAATCVAMTWDKEKYDILVNHLHWDKIDTSKTGKQRLWTDDYSNILSILKLDTIWKSFTHFDYLKLF
ncbi:MAG: spermidine synthase [Candidatus Omnitrophota bacterium]